MADAPHKVVFSQVIHGASIRVCVDESAAANQTQGDVVVVDGKPTIACHTTVGTASASARKRNVKYTDFPLLEASNVRCNGCIQVGTYEQNDTIYWNELLGYFTALATEPTSTNLRVGNVKVRSNITATTTGVVLFCLEASSTFA